MYDGHTAERVASVHTDSRHALRCVLFGLQHAAVLLLPHIHIHYVGGKPVGATSTTPNPFNSLDMSAKRPGTNNSVWVRHRHDCSTRNQHAICNRTPTRKVLMQRHHLLAAFDGMDLDAFTHHTDLLAQRPGQYAQQPRLLRMTSQVFRDLGVCLGIAVAMQCNGGREWSGHNTRGDGGRHEST